MSWQPACPPPPPTAVGSRPDKAYPVRYISSWVPLTPLTNLIKEHAPNTEASIGVGAPKRNIKELCPHPHPHKTTNIFLWSLSTKGGILWLSFSIFNSFCYFCSWWCMGTLWCAKTNLYVGNTRTKSGFPDSPFSPEQWLRETRSASQCKLIWKT